MAHFSVQFPLDEEINPDSIPDINMLMESILASMSGLARDNLLDPHECEGKIVNFCIGLSYLETRPSLNQTKMIIFYNCFLKKRVVIDRKFCLYLI